MTTISLHDEITARIDEVRGDRDLEAFVTTALYETVSPYEATPDPDEPGKFRVVGAFDVVYAAGLDEDIARRHATMLGHSDRALNALDDLIKMSRLVKGEPMKKISDAHIAAAELAQALIGRYRPLADVIADNEKAAEDA